MTSRWANAPDEIQNSMFLRLPPNKDSIPGGHPLSCPKGELFVGGGGEDNKFLHVGQIKGSINKCIII